MGGIRGLLREGRGLGEDSLFKGFYFVLVSVILGLVLFLYRVGRFLIGSRVWDGLNVCLDFVGRM